MMNYFDKNTTALTPAIAEELMQHPENIVNYDLESSEGIEFLKEAVKNNKHILGFLPGYITSDEYIMLYLISAVPQAAAYCKGHNFDRSFMFKAIDVNPWSYIYAPAWVKSDKELSAAACSSCYELLNYVSPNLISSFEFAESCIHCNFRIYSALTRKRDFTDEEKAQLLISEGRLAGYMKDLYQVRESALKLAAANPFLARCIPEEFRSDKEFAAELLERNGLALKYLGNEIQSDRELVKTALANNPMAFLSASDELKADKTFVKEAVSINWFILKYSDNFKDDKDIVTEAVKTNPRAARYMSDRLRSDSRFMEMLADEYPLTAKFSDCRRSPRERCSA